MFYNIYTILSSLPYTNLITLVVPILNDEGYLIGYMFRVQYASNSNIIRDTYPDNKNFNIMYPHFMELLDLELKSVYVESSLYIEYTFYLKGAEGQYENIF